MNDNSKMRGRSEAVTGRMASSLCSLGLISFGLILYEIVLIRIYAVLLSYHYVFAVLSLAVFGLGIGGLLLKKWKTFIPESRISMLAVVTALSVGLVTALILYLSQAVPASWGNAISWIILFLPVFPFLFFGMTIASFFQQAPSQSSLLYGFDIAGGALAALAAVPLLDAIPAPTVSFIVAGVVALASIILAAGERPRGKTVIVSLFLLVLAASAVWIAPTSILPVKNEQNKDINRLLYDDTGSSRIVETRWSAFGQTDLVENDQLTGEKWIYIDGAAGTPMYHWQTLRTDSMMIRDLTVNFGQYFPFNFLQEFEKENALIIGPGGGRDVLVALFGGVKSITGVEVNPDLVQIVKDYEEFNGGIYTRLPNVDIVVGEGRNFLRNTTSQYDLIMLALPVTKGSRSIDGYALTENYLFTVEAFTDYLNSLTPEGRIIFVTHGNAELYRLLTLVLTSFKEQGVPVEQAMKHLYSISRHQMPTLVIQKKPFTPEDVIIRHAALHEFGFDQGSYFLPFQEQRSFDLPLPFDTTSAVEWKMFDQNLVALSEGTRTLDDFINVSSLDITPVRDNNPFFFNFDKDMPPPFRQLFVLIVFGIGIVVMLISVRKPPQQVKSDIIRPYARHPELKLFLLVFLLLGIGFMMLEIALFQKLTLYFGNPVSTTSVLLFSLLLGVGAGSLSSALIHKRLSYALMFGMVSVFILSLGYIYFLDDFLRTATFVSFRAGLLSALLGYAMGFPFPLALRMMQQYSLGKYTYIMWGANALASVAGSVLAMMIGIRWGFTEAVIIGGLIYLLAAILIVVLTYKQNVATMNSSEELSTA